MELKKLSVSNWQNITHLEIEFQKLLILIGESNLGKTNILKCLSAVFNNYEIKDSDFKDKSLPIEIKIKFYKKQKGFFSFKLTKKIKEQTKYVVSNHQKELEVLTEESKKDFLSLKGITISTKENSIYKALNEIKHIFSLKSKESKILKELEKKLSYIENNFLSQGLQRKIFFNFLKNILDNMESYEVDLKEQLHNLILIFEEPELHLNPQESREMSSLLVKLSNIGVQIIIETHSSYFVGIKEYKSICLIRKLNNEIKLYQHTGEIFNGDEIKKFNMNYWINPDRGEIFFAKKVILVEGQTDKIVLSYLAKKLNVYNYNYSIIECGSKSIIPQFIKILNIYRIPYMAVYDKDNHKWRSEVELDNSNIKNKSIRKLINNYIGDFVEFENDIEEEIYEEERERKNYKNKPYYTLQKISDQNYLIPFKLEEKIKKIYK